ncbi:hypothetical protein Tco_0248024 [Tanacetum coccineum]
MLRLCHRLIACNIAGWSRAPKKFIARMAEHFGLLTEERLKGLTVMVQDLPVIDMAKLVRLQICEELDDTWAWVSSGQERQPDVVAGTPQRLEEEVHGMREALGEQREVLDSMACDFSRFTTWTVTSLSLMMDRSRVRYTSYSNFRIPYQRRFRRRTSEASTSAAPPDEDQPDP